MAVSTLNLSSPEECIEASEIKVVNLNQKEEKFYVVNKNILVSSDGFINILKKQNEFLNQKLSAAEEQIEKLNKKVAANNVEIKNLTENLEKEVATKNVEIEKLTKKVQVSEQAGQKQCNNGIRTVLSKRFSEAQIRMLLNNTNKVHWTDEDYRKASTLRDINLRAYEYMRVNMNYPLPGLSSLRKWDHHKIKERQKAKNENKVAENNDNEPNDVIEGEEDFMMQDIETENNSL